MRRTLPIYVTASKDRHGKVRYRYRRTGQKPYSFKSPVGSADFRLEYQECLAGFAAPRVVAGEARAAKGSFDELICQFYRSSEWAKPSQSTKTTYRGIIERFRAKHGHRQVSELRFVHVDRILAQMAATPAAANNLRKILLRLMEFAIKIEMAQKNPVKATRSFPTNTDGWHAWTDAEIERFEERHPLGTMARLAFALMFYTGQRRSDVVRLGRQHVKGGKVSVSQQKTGAKLLIPVHTELAAAIKAMPKHDHLTFLVTAFGKPFSVAGFGNWFRDRCDEAGLHQCSAHGLRKAISRQMAEMGVTHSQGKSVTGHVTDKEFTRYAQAADQVILAEQAMANLERGLAKNQASQT